VIDEMNKKITLQDIADEMGLSRNTISKALNDHDDVAEETKRMVQNTAIALGYKKFNIISDSARNTIESRGNIVFLNYGDTVETSYWSFISKGIEEELSKKGYNLILNFINAEDEKNLVLPRVINQKSTDGILLMGSLNEQYIHKICTQQVPIVLIDAPSTLLSTQLRADVVMMENEDSVFALAEHLIHLGHKEIGFIGDIQYSKSIQERWYGFVKAMKENGLSIDLTQCIIHETLEQYQDPFSIEMDLDKMKKMPTAFVCANDRIAIHTIRLLQKRKYHIPEDISVVGFDDIQEATIVDPALTTVQVHKEEIGRRAAAELIWRIENPEQPYEFIRIQNCLKWRNSTSQFIEKNV